MKSKGRYGQFVRWIFSIIDLLIVNLAFYATMLWYDGEFGTDGMYSRMAWVVLNVAMLVCIYFFSDVHERRVVYADKVVGQALKLVLTHAGIYGVDASMRTLEDLYGIDITYYVRVNFNTLVQVVNALDGVDVYIEEGFQPFTDSEIYIERDRTLGVLFGGLICLFICNPRGLICLFICNLSGFTCLLQAAVTDDSVRAALDPDYEVLKFRVTGQHHFGGIIPLLRFLELPVDSSACESRLHIHPSLRPRIQVAGAQQEFHQSDLHAHAGEEEGELRADGT